MGHTDKIFGMGTGFDMIEAKLATAAIGVGFLQWLGVETHAQFVGLLAIAVLDSFSGVVAAWHQGHRITSSRWEQGVMRKVIAMCLISAIAILHKTTPAAAQSAVPVELGLTIVCGLVGAGWVWSIAENLAIVGGLPRPLQGALENNLSRPVAESKAKMPPMG